VKPEAHAAPESIFGASSDLGLINPEPGLEVLSWPEQIEEISDLSPRVFLGEAAAHDSSVTDCSSGV
jgi:hypothetical protein